ncbi:hypothetical protein FDECE_13491 [Fusarium decemcellulare]|nr:hypothetical protein FDECE_13491 [Fusarium decemcellulare]
MPKCTDKAYATMLEGIIERLDEMEHRMNASDGRWNHTESLLPNRTQSPRPKTKCGVEAKDGRALASPRAADRTSTEAHPNRPSPPILARDAMKAELGPPAPPKEHAIPMKNTTLPQLLLGWPSIQELTKHHVEKRLQAPTDQDSLNIVDGSSNVASLSAATDWDQLGGHNPLDQVERRGDFCAFEENPDISEEQVRSYVESFKKNILNMYPILQPTLLDLWVRNFLAALPVSQPQPGSKRKRPPEPDSPDSFKPAPTRAGWPGQSIHSAIILMVLALGKFCLRRDNIPDTLHSANPPPSDSSPTIRTGAVRLAPPQGSSPGFPSRPHSTRLPSPEEQNGGIQGRRPSIQGVGAFRSGYSTENSNEAIPGLRSLDRMREMKNKVEKIKDPYDNELALAFWTCFQIESDLMVVLQLLPSALLSYGDSVPYPNMRLLEGFDQRILDSYLQQSYLQAYFNRIYRKLYIPRELIEIDEDTFGDVRAIVDVVVGTRWMAPSFAFGQDYPPADDILAARLREKYWGAQVITYRPFIRQILQLSHSKKNHASNLSVPCTSSEFRQNAAIYAEAETHGNIDPKVEEYAKKGIDALVESTRAFHGLGDDRPILANVFGTAHAQWGNLLVLSAAFKDPVLSEYVDEELLRTLFRKTIQFLRQSATTTRSLRTDMHILEGLQRDLFPPSDERTNPRFSSGTGVRDYYTPRPVVMAAPP